MRGRVGKKEGKGGGWECAIDVRVCRCGSAEVDQRMPSEAAGDLASELGVGGCRWSFEKRRVGETGIR